MKDEARTLDPDPVCVCDHTASLHCVQSGMCLAVDQEGHSCSCMEFRLYENERPTEQLKARASADLSTQIEALRGMVRKARKRRLTPEEQDVLAELAESIRTLLGETDQM